MHDAEKSGVLFSSLNLEIGDLLLQNHAVLCNIDTEALGSPSSHLLCICSKLIRALDVEGV